MITNLKQVTKYSNIPGYVERKSQRMLGVELGRPATRNELVEHKKDHPSFQLRKILENRDRERDKEVLFKARKSKQSSESSHFSVLSPKSSQLFFFFLFFSM
jgi:hypothetical protein